MRRNLWTAAVWLTVAGAVAAGPLAPATPQSQLLAPGTTAGGREEAARRLLAGGTASDLATLQTGLRSATPGVQVAVAQAVAKTSNPPVALLRDVAAPLTGGPVTEAATAAAAAALAAYAGTARADEALNALQRFADDDRVPALIRIPAVRAMASFVARRSAEYLVRTATANPPTPVLQRAAATALGELSGEPSRGTDPAAWSAWWSAHAGQGEDAWRAYLLGVRTRDAPAVQGAAADLAQSATQALQDTYAQLPPAAKPGVLLAYMASPSALIRGVGAQLVGTDAATDAVLDRLHVLIADDDAAVRLKATVNAQFRTDHAAGPALAVQLGRETVPVNQAREIATLAKIGEVDATAAILARLDDSSPEVATAAANAVGQPDVHGMGSEIRARRPDLARDAAAALRRAIDRPHPPFRSKFDDVRAAAIVALSAVPDGQTFNLYHALLSADEPWNVRVAALDGFGALGDSRASDIVGAALEDADKRVRFAAARAMLTVARVGQEEQLFAFLNPQKEGDPDIRQACWRALERVLTLGGLPLLERWVDRFPDDPARSLAVRERYAAALAAAPPNAANADAAAANAQEIGHLLVRLQRPAEAVPRYQAAIDFFIKNQAGGGPPLSEELVGQMIHAQLGARQFQAAVDFAAAQIRREPGLRSTAGRVLQDEADHLRADNRPADARTLVDLALAMQPPLSEKRMDDLRQIRGELTGPGPR